MRKIDKIVIGLIFSIPVVFVICFFLWGMFFGPNRQELFIEDSTNLMYKGIVDSIYYDK